jgi:hypothetical protein
MNKQQMLVIGVLGGGGAAAVTYSISGTVTDADGSTAVSGATVALGAYSAESGVDGTYTITGIPADTSGSMTCTKTGYVWTAISVSAMSGNLTGQDFMNAWWAGGGAGAICAGYYAAAGAGSLAASYSNLLNPGTNDMAVASGQSAPDFVDATGWTFVKVNNDVLVPGLRPTASWSVICKYTNGGTDLSALFGAYVGATNCFYMTPGAANRYYGNGAILTVSGNSPSGVMCIAGKKAYFNGAADGTISAGGSVPAFDTAVGAYATGASAWTPSNVTEQGIVFYNDTLTPTQVAQITAGMNLFFLNDMTTDTFTYSSSIES